MLCLLIILLSSCERPQLVDPDVPVRLAEPVTADCWVPDHKEKRIVKVRLSIPAGKMIIDRQYWLLLKKAEGE